MTGRKEGRTYGRKNEVKIESKEHNRGNVYV
jgi:hypothetical protein